MSDPTYEILVKRYAEGRKLCNCKEAYQDASGGCAYGCSSNARSAKIYIAGKVVEEFGLSYDCKTRG